MEIGLDSAISRWGNNPLFSTSRNSSGSVSRVKRQLIDFPDDAVLEWSFKLVVPLWSYGDASKFFSVLH